MPLVLSPFLSLSFPPSSAVVCAGQIVRPGDVVLADDDGVVVIGVQVAEAVLRASVERERKEAVVRAHYSSGELGLDLNDMRSRLTERGLSYLRDGNPDVKAR